MSADQLFSMASGAAVLGWITLALGAALRRPAWVRLAGLAWPLGFAALYTLLIVLFFAKAPGGFNSLADVQLLFTSHWAALAGWVHYLAFDLFVGGWITLEVLRLGLSRLVLVVVLPLTFLFGPIGLLLHGLARLALQPRESLA